MIFFELLLAVVLFRQVQSQSQQISIVVGEGGLYIVHPSLHASIGDIIVFSFVGNYSLVQGSYATPCWPLVNGFYSGFVPLPPDAQGTRTVFAVPITNLEPIYYYSGQVGNCQAGMAGSINPPCDNSDSFLDYQSAAKLVTSVGPLPSAVTGGYLVSSTNGEYPVTFSTTSPLPSAASPSVSVCTVCPGGSNTDQVLCSNVPEPTGSTLSSSATVTHPGVASSTGLSLLPNSSTSSILQVQTSGAIQTCGGDASFVFLLGVFMSVICF